jgi:H+-translocating NAD(P) transhydrogenase subunit beta
MNDLRTTLAALLYLGAAVLFILGIIGLTKVRSARRGNALAAVGMLLAVLATVLEIGATDYRWILLGMVVGSAVGYWWALRVEMTQMPEMVALFNGFGGAASALVAFSTQWLDTVESGRPGTVADIMGNTPAVMVALSLLIGGVTFSGSLVAFLKLNGTMRGEPVLIPGRHAVNALLLAASLGLGLWFAVAIPDPMTAAAVSAGVLLLSLLLGVLLVIPIGGADMPVVISLLNSYSGLAAAATGFIIGNAMLIIAGALVGASGIILSQVMCVAMNRSLANVLFGGFGAVAPGAGGSSEYGPVRSGGPEEAAMLLEAAESVCIVPGYGLAVAQAQHAVREIADLLKQRGATVFYAIHPVAGRMPGHMNVLLAEADVPYEELYELEPSNAELKNTDVVLVVGANDVINPAAQDTPGSPIAGMPVLEVWHGRSVIVIKRSLSPGFAGIKNSLFERENTMMLFLDAKKAVQGILSELKSAAAA